MKALGLLTVISYTTAAYGQEHVHPAAPSPPVSFQKPPAAAPGHEHQHDPLDVPKSPFDALMGPAKKKGRILYYRNPMGEADTSPVPKKDSMGMDYIPVYEADVAPPIADHAADSFFDPAAMAAARAQLKAEHGGEPVSMFIVNVLESQQRKGETGYRWDSEGWYGGDLHRAFIKFKGEGATKRKLEQVELQALYARAVGPYFNLQAGVRYDWRPDPSRAYATFGMEGLAPYWFDVAAAVFVSNKADVHARLDGYYDLNITQRLIFQPRAEIDFAAKDVPALGVGAGISSVEAELRLRYEIRREFAPYIGISFERKVGRTADMARAAGAPTTATSFAAGVRMFF